MNRYDEILLNALLDSYESSLLSKGENKVRIRIAFNFTKKALPEYFDESSLIYEAIHSAAKQLEELGPIEISWREDKKDHIIRRIYLSEGSVKAAYEYLGRTPKINKVEQTEALRLMRKLDLKLEQECIRL